MTASVDYKLGTFDMVTSPSVAGAVMSYYSTPAEGDFRLWVDGRCNEGPLRLLVCKWAAPPEGINYRVWECEALWHQKIVEEPEFDIGRVLLPEEVLAWMGL